MVKDLAQSAILVNFITDFINKTVKEEWDSKLCNITDDKDLAQCMGNFSKFYNRLQK